ncbi:hypothetical protein JAAARDRAFT_189689 [Jaapia argillacea MUCL 33604]|uniref:Phosphatidate cytidylyltransferase, mitochondrial n=1 Tax=Jaapia argillacea MUCL 33604 TaxID=933084 RepID=A0A067Q880_9AGAM|nr:hypothetical protein JAAARDRAFT_189689 [Jaapia argillacea MUCL 33604]
MLSVVARGPRPCLALRPAAVRSFATETVTSSSNPPPPPLHSPPPKRTRLHPAPRPTRSHRHPTPFPLPPTFGRNQLLPVTDSTRALLESIVADFEAPVRYAFAYGSGVFEQDGYAAKDTEAGPMLDFMFAVTHADHWHSINMNQHPSHYPLHARMLGSSFVSRVEDISPGVWFNTMVKVKGVNIKYGVTTVDNLCSDLLNWRTLYLAGRMHKPIRIIKDDPRVRLTQQVNLTSAIRAALLTLPSSFSETELFERIAGISYSGDPRMLLPAENRNKVANIVRKQSPQFKELYHRLVIALPGVHWSPHSSTIEQDSSPLARSNHLRKLPLELLTRVENDYAQNDQWLRKEADEISYWTKMAGDERLSTVLRNEMSDIVRYPATIQSLKGIVSAGLVKSVRYTSEKVGKWWKSRGSGSASNQSQDKIDPPSST